jgi:hypothetical protein
MNSNYNNPNNIHHNFPGIMSDGRLFTNYKNSSMIDKEMMEKQSFKSNQTYRKFLVDNANNIMNLNKETYMNQNNTYYSNNEPLHVLNMKQQRHNNPYLFDSIHDKVQPYGYETNIVKEKYLSRQELSAKTVNKYKN